MARYLFFSVKTIFLYLFLVIFLFNVYQAYTIGELEYMFKQPLIIAHRGVSDTAPENTMAAFYEMKKIGIQALECDVRISKDGCPIIAHDDDLMRVGSPKSCQKIEDLTCEEIKQLNVGSWFNSSFASEKVPCLKELLQADLGPVIMNLEIKIEDDASDDHIEFIVRNVLKTIKEEESHLKHKELLLGSLSPKVVKSLKKHAPKLDLVGIAETEHSLLEHLDLKVKRISIDYKLLNPHLAQTLINQGIRLWVWTVDDPKTCHELVSYGVEGIITNRPKMIRDSFQNVE